MHRRLEKTSDSSLLLHFSHVIREPDVYALFTIRSLNPPKKVIYFGLPNMSIYSMLKFAARQPYRPCFVKLKFFASAHFMLRYCLLDLSLPDIKQKAVKGFDVLGVVRI